MRDGIIEDTPVAQCATGCRVRGQHLTSCTNPCGEDCGRRCDDHCRGCRPKRAYGDLAVCSHCRDKVALAITSIPTLVSWISAQDAPSSGAASNGDKIKRTKKSPPMPFRADAIDTADALHALLVSWVRIAVEDRPGGMAGPNLWGSVAARRVLADQTGAVVGLGVNNPSRVAAGRRSDSEGWTDRLNAKGEWADEDWVIAPSPTRNAATWLTTHLEWALAQPWAGDLVAELTTAVRQARRRWPVEAEPKIAEAECFDCGHQLVCESGDKGYSADWTCSGCGKSYNEDQYNQALLYLRSREQSAMEVRIAAGESDAGDDRAYVSVEDAATWTGRKAWTIRTWMQQDLVRKRKVGAKVQVNLYDVTREHGARDIRQPVCVPGSDVPSSLHNRRDTSMPKAGK